MKIKTVISFLSLLLAILMCASCTSGENVFSYNSENGAVVDQKTGTEYLAASSYEAKKRSAEPYATVMLGGAINTPLYLVGDEDPIKLLCDEDEIIYCSSSVTLPTLPEMNPNKIYICEGRDGDFASASIDGADEIAEIIDTYMNGESIVYPATGAESIYSLKFSSDEYPSSYYSFLYIEYSEEVYSYGDDGVDRPCGKNFFYNRFEGRFVPAGDLISRHFLDNIEPEDSGS